MRSIDSQETTTLTVTQFKEKVKKTIQDVIAKKRELSQNMKTEKPELSRYDLKALVRILSLTNAKNLGLNKEDAQKIYQYFFQFIYEEQEEIEKMWETLYQLSQNANNEVKVKELFNKLLELNPYDKNMLWRLIQNIVNGDDEIKVINIGNEPIYYLDISENSVERRNDTIIEQLKQLLGDEIIQKPTVPQAINNMAHNDKNLFLKIFTFLQSDVDTLLASETWRLAIDSYFDGVPQYLQSIVNALTIGKGKSRARKERFENFISSNAFKNYLENLRDYAKKIALGSNPFAEDMLFEHYLRSNNLLVNEFHEPSVLILNIKWDNLAKEIQQYADKDATMYGIPTLPSKKDNVEAIRYNVKRQLPHIPNEPDTKADSSTTTTQQLTALIEEELARFPNNHDDDPHHSEPLSIGTKHGINSTVYFYAKPEKTETDVLMEIKNAVLKAFHERQSQITQGIDEDFISKLTTTAKKFISTSKLMTEFISLLIIHYENITNNLDDDTTSNIFDNIVEALNRICPDKNISLPNSSSLEELKHNIPSIDSAEFSHLRKHLEEKNLYEKFKALEEQLRHDILEKKIRHFSLFKELYRIFNVAFVKKEGCRYHRTTQENNKNQALKLVKKTKGNKFTNFFRLFGISKEVKEEMQTYLNQLTESINITWDRALNPALSLYENVVFSYESQSQQK